MSLIPTVGITAFSLMLLLYIQIKKKYFLNKNYKEAHGQSNSLVKNDSINAENKTGVNAI